MSLFNMGYCAFQIAFEEEQAMATVALTHQDASEDETESAAGMAWLAIDYYEQSAAYFRAAFKIDPSEMAAAQNMELARYRAQQVRDALKKQEEEENPPNDEGEKTEGENMESEEGEEGQDGDSEESDPGENFEEGESEDGDPSNLGRSQTSLTDLNNQALPPPTLTPEDLLDEEILNNELRDKASGRRGKPVERDW